MAVWKGVGNAAPEIDPARVPQHIAIILDGNGRWAKRRGLPRVAGHAAGAENFRTIAGYCQDLGVTYLTVYAFSTENWRRPESEVAAIMDHLRRYVQEAIRDADKNQLRLCFFGDLSVLSEELRTLCHMAEEVTAGYRQQVNVCLNYGGREELVRGAVAFARDCVEGRARPEELTQARFERYLDSAAAPDPDLIIRPGGELRLSNFLLWKCAYAELYFTDVLWPDFNKTDLLRAVAAFQKRDRRFGGLGGDSV